MPHFRLNCVLAVVEITLDSDVFLNVGLWLKSVLFKCVDTTQSTFQTLLLSPYISQMKCVTLCNLFVKYCDICIQNYHNDLEGNVAASFGQFSKKKFEM